MYAHSDAITPPQVTTPPKQALHKYHKQLITSRTTAFHKHNMQLMGYGTPEEEQADRRNEVVKMVARELWTNFIARGEKTAMLDYLHENLRKEFGDDLDFAYEANGFELQIFRKNEKGNALVNQKERISIVNRAWQLAAELVESFTLTS